MAPVEMETEKGPQTCKNARPTRKNLNDCGNQNHKSNTKEYIQQVQDLFYAR